MYEWTSHDLALAVEKIENLTSFSFISDCLVHCSKFYFRIPFEVVAKNINWRTFDSWLINQLPMMIKEDRMSDGTTIWTNPKYRSHSFYEVFLWFTNTLYYNETIRVSLTIQGHWLVAAISIWEYGNYSHFSPNS